MPVTGVRYSSPTNSTLFTNCCGVAVCDDQNRCPVCDAEVYPENPRSRHRVALRQQIYAEHMKRVDRLCREDRARERQREIAKGGQS